MASSSQQEENSVGKAPAATPAAVPSDPIQRASSPRLSDDLQRAGGMARAYTGSAVAVAGACLVAYVLQSLVSVIDLAMVFLPAVLFSAVTWGLGPSVFASILSVLCYDFLFVPPLFTLTISQPDDVLALVVLLIVAVLTSELASRVRAEADAAQRREKETATLYALSQQLARSAGLDQVAQAIAGQVSSLMGTSVTVLLPGASGLEVKAAQPPRQTLNPDEWAAAMWVWEHNRRAGPGGESLPGSAHLFLPLTTVQGTLGVLEVSNPAPEQELSAEQQRLLQALADQSAVAIERARLGMAMAEARSLAESERLRSALLSSVSHDLRTPLASIIGAVTSVLSFGDGYKPEERRDLLETIREEAERLNRFVGNLLEMTRLESGALNLNRQWVEIGDILGSALAHLEQPLSKHRLTVKVEPGLPLLPLDFVLTEQVFVNLLDNAARYSQPGTAIDVWARREGGVVAIDVADEGVGVPPPDLEHIFDKFYRIRQGDRQSVGIGLGLSICRGLVEAQGGKITAHLRSSGKGTVFTVKLAIQPAPKAVAEGKRDE